MIDRVEMKHMGFMRSHCIRCIAGVLLLVLCPNRLHASEQPYVVAKKYLPGRRVQITLSQRHSGNLVWRQIFKDYLMFFWSSDHRALCISEFQPDAYYRLYLWREGRTLQIVDKLPALYADVLGGVRWSPDHRRLLILRSVGMGNGTVGLYDLFCYRLRDKRQHFIAAYVTDAAWIDEHKILYHQSGYRTIVKNGLQISNRLPETLHHHRCP